MCMGFVENSFTFPNSVLQLPEKKKGRGGGCLLVFAALGPRAVESSVYKLHIYVCAVSMFLLLAGVLFSWEGAQG